MSLLQVYCVVNLTYEFGKFLGKTTYDGQGISEFMNQEVEDLYSVFLHKSQAVLDLSVPVKKFGPCYGLSDQRSHFHRIEEIVVRDFFPVRARINHHNPVIFFYGIVHILVLDRYDGFDCYPVFEGMNIF